MATKYLEVPGFLWSAAAITLIKVNHKREV